MSQSRLSTSLRPNQEPDPPDTPEAPQDAPSPDRHFILEYRSRGGSDRWPIWLGLGLTVLSILLTVAIAKGWL